MTREVVTTTVTKEYDETGKLVKETTETVTEREGHATLYQHVYWPTYPTYPQYPWWTVTSGTTACQISGTQAAAGSTYYINGATN